MKIKSLLIGMLACSALVACTNDDVLENPNDNPVLNGKEEAYMKVKLVMNETTSSRATGDAGYAKGEANEQSVEGDNSIFLFYDAQGKWVTSGVLVDASELKEGDASDHNHGTGEDGKPIKTDVNSIYDDAYVVLEGPSQDLQNKITQVLTVVNYSGAHDLTAKQLDLEEALVEINETTDPSNGSAVTNGKKAGYVMSTSVYYDEENKKIVNTTAIVEGNICDTQKAALDNPVKIYIERASAKIQLKSKNTVINSALTGDNALEVISKGENQTQTEGKADITIDGVEYPLWIEINGWTVNNVNTTSNLVKNISADWATTSPLVGNVAWNQPNDYRSYWAMGTKYNESDGSKLTAYSYNEAVSNLNSGLVNQAMYCYEQTVATTNIDPLRSSIVANPNTPTILIAAKILKEEKSGETITKTAVGDIFKYGGIFYSLGEYTKLLVKQVSNSYYTLDDENKPAALTVNDITLTAKANGLAKVSFVAAAVEGKKIYKDVTAEGSSEPTQEEVIDLSEIATAINKLAYVTGAEYYKGGNCYYQIPIEHLSSTGKIKETVDEETGAINKREVEGTYLYGVVRNHWYQLNISNVANIGEPVADPDIEIPEIPMYDTSYYLAAELHVLNWHVVNQDVTLE